MGKNTDIFESVDKHRGQIMGLAAVWVFVFHVRNELGLFGEIPFLSRAEFYCNTFGFCGVDIFLLLSGWGLYHAINKHSLKDFYIRRFRRLFLPFFVVAFAKALYGHWDILRYVKALTGWTFLTENVYEPIWFIPSIALMYLFFPLYRFVFEKFSNKYVFTGAAIALWYALAVLETMISPRTDIYLFINRIPVFMVGVLCGWMTYNKKKISGIVPWIVLAAMLVAGFVLMNNVLFEGWHFLLPEPRNGLPAFLIGISMCFLSGKLFNLLDRVKVIQKAYGFVGKMSLEFYVVQEIILYSLYMEVYFSGSGFNLRLLVLITLLLALGGGYILYLIETVISKKMDGKPVFTAPTKKK